MTEPRKPIFGFIFRGPSPDGPVDADYRQVRGLLVPARGPVRLAVLVLATLATLMLAGSALMAALASGLSAVAVLGGLVVASALVVVMRAWVVGTRVDDAGVTIERLWSRRRVAWPEVAAILVVEEPCPWLGLPLPVDAARSVLVTTDGERVPTHVQSASPDLWRRPEAFDIATDQLQTWWQESRPPQTSR